MYEEEFPSHIWNLDLASEGLRTRWEAEKLYIKEGEGWVVHRVCTTC